MAGAWKDRRVIGNAVLSVKTGRSRAIRMYPKIGPCEVCGSPKSERHHRDENTLNNAPDNIAILCRRCHTLAHGKTVLPHVQEMGRTAAAAKKKAKTHCPQGHSYSGDNLYTYADGRRSCKICALDAKHRYRAGGGRG